MGDVVEVTVLSGELPAQQDRTSDSESFVMINLDGRHQVQQARVLQCVAVCCSVLQGRVLQGSVS